MPDGRLGPAATPAPLGAGVVGLGEIGQFHVQGLERSARTRLVAVADVDAGRRSTTASATGARPHADLDALLEDPDVEMVSICLPHSLHLPATLAALAAGKHVLIEKPLAMSTEECDEIIAAAARSGVVAGVQHNQLFYPPHARAKELIDAGAIGTPVHIRLRLGIGGKLGGWRADPAVTGGGLLFDAGVHRFYVARHLFGEIAEVRALTDHARDQGEDRAVVSLRFENGAFGVIDANYDGPPGMFDDSVEIVGTEQALYLSGCEAGFESFRTGPALRRYDGAWHDERVPPGGWDDSVAMSIDAFAEAVRAPGAPPATLADGRRIVELIETAYSSASAMARA